MKNNERVFLSIPHMSGREEKYVQEAFRQNWIAPLGPNVDKFEESIKDYTGTSNALALSSGTAALHLALRVLDIGEGDFVFCSSLTFVASANPIIYQGATPIFIDSEPETWNMSPQALKRAFEYAENKNMLPKAVIVVNLYGQSADMDNIVDICKEYNVPIVEDAAESLGATYKGEASGTFGRLGVFSFNGNKIITTSGGGMLISDDADLLQKARHLATQAREKAVHYQHNIHGYNYRLSNVLAGIGRGQMEVLDERINTKRAVFKKYKSELEDITGIEFMPEADFGKHTRWLTTLLINPNLTNVTRDDIIETLEEMNIESRPVWKPMHLQPLFSEAMYFPHELNDSISDKLFNTGICLPSGTNLTQEKQTVIINVIKKLMSP